MCRGIDDYTFATWFKVSCERPGGRRLGPGSGWAGLFRDANIRQLIPSCRLRFLKKGIFTRSYHYILFDICRERGLN